MACGRSWAQSSGKRQLDYLRQGFVAGNDVVLPGSETATAGSGWRRNNLDAPYLPENVRRFSPILDLSASGSTRTVPSLARRPPRRSSHRESGAQAFPR